jgi:alcohol dehydrogenase (cytochrome c)
MLKHFIALLIVLSMSVASASAANTGTAGWLTYGYTLANTRHVGFPQITSTTVHALVPVWKFRTGIYGPFETTPIVVGRTMFITTGADHAVTALDATSGAVLWQYKTDIRPVFACCGMVNRGVAVDSGLVFFATLDDRLIALDAGSGVKRWETQIADPAEGNSETMAPLAWHGMVLIGSSGGEREIRGSFSAYSQTDGKLIWRWWTVSPGWEGQYVNRVHGISLGRDISREKREAKTHHGAWRHGGGPVWMTPALDAARSVIYLSVGNPSFESDDERPGDNLYTSSVVALDARTGKLKWYYQEVPHDLWDYDAASPAVLFETRDVKLRVVSAVGEAGKTGWFYILNRDSGEPIRVSEPVVLQRDMFKPPTPAGIAVSPSGYAGAIAPVAFDPASHLVFVQAKEGTYFKRSTDRVWHPLGTPLEILSAVDADTGKIAWRKIIGDASTPDRAEGPLSAADLVFIGQETGGAFEAREAKTGNLLWSYRTDPGGETESDSPRRSFSQTLHDLLASLKRWLRREPATPPPVSHVHASPIAYVVDGREYIAVAADANFRWGRSPGDTVYVFSLPR